MSELDESGAPVVKFRPPGKVIGRHRFCKHIAVEIDGEFRRLTCLECGATVDEYAWMVMVAEQWESIERYIARLRADEEKLVAEVAELRKTRNALATSVRRRSKTIAKSTQP